MLMEIIGRSSHFFLFFFFCSTLICDCKDDFILTCSMAWYHGLF